MIVESALSAKFSTVHHSLHFEVVHAYHTILSIKIKWATHILDYFPTGYDANTKQAINNKLPKAFQLAYTVALLQRRSPCVEKEKLCGRHDSNCRYMKCLFIARSL